MTNSIAIYNQGSFLDLDVQQLFEVTGKFEGTKSIANLVSGYSTKKSFRLGMIAKKLSVVAKELSLGEGEILEILIASNCIKIVTEQSDTSAKCRSSFDEYWEGSISASIDRDVKAGKVRVIYAG